MPRGTRAVRRHRIRPSRDRTAARRAIRSRYLGVETERKSGRRRARVGNRRRLAARSVSAGVGSVRRRPRRVGRGVGSLVRGGQTCVGIRASGLPELCEVTRLGARINREREHERQRARRLRARVGQHLARKRLTVGAIHDELTSKGPSGAHDAHVEPSSRLSILSKTRARCALHRAARRSRRAARTRRAPGTRAGSTRCHRRRGRGDKPRRRLHPGRAEENAGTWVAKAPAHSCMFHRHSCVGRYDKYLGGW